jgi:putative hydrolase of the HAD superfamily
MIPAGTRALFFDAVGTILFPQPAAALVYAEVGRRHGSRYSEAEIDVRFREAFRQQEKLDELLGWATSEWREEQRWRQIVGHVLDDVADAACFRELWDHFAQPGAWRCAGGTGPVLRELHCRGYRLGLASNFDGRLRSVVAGLPELSPIDRIVISSEVGFRKPAGCFFKAVTTAAGVVASEVLFVGDDPANDYHGARNAGMHALLYDPLGQAPGSLATLADLLK